MSITYEISLVENGRVTDLGVLALDAENAGTLTLLGDGPAHAALAERWARVAAEPAVTVQRSYREQEADGSWIRYTGTETIGKDSADYPYALVQYLGWSYGYVLTPREATAE